MSDNVSLWTKDHKYYVVGCQECALCGSSVENLGVYIWTSDDASLSIITCLGCHKKVSGKIKMEAKTLFRVVEERVLGSILVIKPFTDLINSNNELTSKDVVIIDKTVHAGRESFKGFSVGLISDPRASELDKELLSIDRRLLLEERKRGIKENN